MENLMFIGAIMVGDDDQAHLAIKVMVKYITKAQSQITFDMVEMLKLQVI
jgi:hypothetical protein